MMKIGTTDFGMIVQNMQKNGVKMAMQNQGRSGHLEKSITFLNGIVAYVVKERVSNMSGFEIKITWPLVYCA